MVAAVVLMGNFIGCNTFSHTQSVRNETGQTVVGVYSRDTGTGDWGQARNVRPRTDAHGHTLRGPDGNPIRDRFNMNSGTGHNLFTGGFFSADPPSIRNQDIRMIDNNGLRYTKHNVPIAFTSYSERDFFLWRSRPVQLNRAEPITFTARDRHPILFIRNETGRSVNITSPTRTVQNIPNAWWQLPELNRAQNVTVNYTIGRFQFREQVTLNNEDVTLVLTRRPPEIVVQNNTGATVNAIFIRASNQPEWTNILAPGAGIVSLAHTVISGDRFAVALEQLPLTGDRFDIRLVHVGTGQEHIMFNVHIPYDVILTFTAAHRH